MTETESSEAGGPLNGAVLRVLGGVLVGIGISPVVAGLVTYPLRVAFGEEFAFVFRGAVYLLAVVFGLVVLHVVRLFYRGDWRSLRDGDWQRSSERG